MNAPPGEVETNRDRTHDEIRRQFEVEVRRKFPARNRAAGEHDEAFARHQLAHQSARLMNRDAPVDASGDVRGDVPAATDELAIFLVCLCASSSACAEPQRGRNWCKTRILYVI